MTPAPMYNPSSDITSSVTNLGSDFGTVAPTALGLAVAAFALRWLFHKATSLAS